MTLSSEQDRTTVTENMYENLEKFRHVVFKYMNPQTVIQTNRQTDRQTDKLFDSQYFASLLEAK